MATIVSRPTDPAEFPVPVGKVVKTLVQIFRVQGNEELAGLLDRSAASFDQTDYDNWNGGTYTWALRLEVPVPVYASIQPRLDEVEKTILGKLAYLGRTYPNDNLSEVTISPTAADDLAAGQHLAPADYDVRRIWAADRFRLFLSHLATHKVAISKLKAELADLGVAGFVAHEDIEPTRAWMGEIALALRSMNALVALVTPDFHASQWTDQEIGWALGRGLLVISVRLGADPLGFVSQSQAASGALTDPKALAASIVEVLLANPQTHHEMRHAIVFAVRDARSFPAIQSLRKFIRAITDFTPDEKKILWAACSENPKVANGFYVTDDIYKAIGQPPTSPAPTPAAESGPPLSDDDIPF